MIENDLFRFASKINLLFKICFVFVLVLEKQLLQNKKGDKDNIEASLQLRKGRGPCKA